MDLYLRERQPGALSSNRATLPDVIADPRLDAYRLLAVAVD